jgi:hypothetical protein
MTTVTRGWTAGWDTAARAGRRICCALVNDTGRRGAPRRILVGSRLAAGWAPRDGTHHRHRALPYHREGSDRMAEWKWVHSTEKREMCTKIFRGDCSDIEQVDDTTGDTPLMAAARRGDDASSVRALLDSGASVRARNKVRSLLISSLVTPHPFLPFEGLSKVAQTAHPQDGWTALHAAAYGGNAEIAEHLLNAPGGLDMLHVQDRVITFPPRIPLSALHASLPCIPGFPPLSQPKRTTSLSLARGTGRAESVSLMSKIGARKLNQMAGII